MQQLTQQQRERVLGKPGQRAFSLIELLVVLAIIAILAGMLMVAFGGASKEKQLARIKSSREEIVTAIDEYHAKRGFYPPTITDKQGAPILDKPILFYELVGTRFDSTGGTPMYHSLDGKEHLSLELLDTLFGGKTARFSNSGLKATDAENFYRNLRNDGKSEMEKVFPAAAEFQGKDYDVLTVPVKSGSSAVLMWRYNSVNPTNNPGRYDLWVEWDQGKKTEIIGNW